MAVERLNIPDNIIIVIKHGTTYKDTDIPQGFVVDPTNIKQLEKARDWGRVVIPQYQFGQYQVIEPKEIFTRNENFKLTFLDAADTSSQGGKLSFWNCLIEKDDIKAIIGIQQENILSLIKQSTIVNGIVNGVSLAKRGATACVCHSGMKEWQVSRDNTPIGGEKAKVKKTTKWEIGKSYRTLTKHELYMGKLLRWMDYETTYKQSVNMSGGYRQNINITHYHFKLLDKPIEQHIIMEQGLKYKEAYCKVIESGEVKTLKELYTYIANRVRQTKENNSIYYLDRESHIFGYGAIINNTPSREIAELSLDATDYADGLNELLSVCKEKYKEFAKTKGISIDSLVYMFGYTNEFGDKPSFTDEDKEFILDNCTDTIHIDFGDGVEHTGRKSNG